MNLADLSIRDLEAIVAVADAGHFGRAALSLGIAQPTLSAQVRKAELLLGVELFERTGRRFLITSAGERLLPLVRDLIARARALASEAAAGTSAAPLKLGVIPTLGPYLVPHLLARNPGTHAVPPLVISEQQTAILNQQLRDGTIDAALLSIPLQADGVRELPLFDEPFVLVVPRGHHLASIPRLVPSSLSAADMVLLEEGHCLRDQALAVCGYRGGDRPRVVAASLETLKYLVGAGEGYSLLPALSCRLTPELGQLVEVRQFDDRTPSRRIGICVRASFPRLADVEALAAFVRERVVGSFAPMGISPTPGRRSPTPSARS